uniref:Phage protein n=1 Tax=Siphoviridae sp. ctBtT10 TaxID=2827805 RepID=A0A8S5SXZ9_9CAUD|nr:MAG TPA: Protein of unknown function (DUF1642) [Siphoviridae sp. ctBtT10]
MNKQELIKIYEDTSCTLISINGVLEDLRQLDEPQPIKLKDVIARIEKFDLGTKAVWINEILNKLGSDYGTLKYKAGYEQGKFEGEWVGQQLKDADKIRQELNKPMIPQFVADWYEEHKDDFEIALFRCIDHIPSVYDEGDLNEFEEWIIDGETKPFQTLVNMHQFGYTVEKEKRYLVKVIGMSKFYECLNFDTTENRWKFFDCDNTKTYRTHHTRKELEDADFGWVFDCPGIEIEEVEG